MTNLNKQNTDAGIPVVKARHDQLPIREEKPEQAPADPPPYDAHASPVGLQLHHIRSKDALFVRIQPPKEPSKPISHVACDVVLVIDVSWSMEDAAPIPGEGAEETGLSILDLTKHAALTIIETMDERDRLGIVTFETRSKVVQRLEPMTDSNKEEARKRVKALKPLGATNLWGGMLDAINLFSKEQDGHRVPAMMILTDGAPNQMCPPQGYIPKLRTMPPLPATIHTFGFGYSPRSGLLRSIAEFSGGNYAFIPDAGMIGTVFVHAMANLQSTFATKASLKLKYAAAFEVEQTIIDTFDQNAPVDIGNGQRELTISLENIQYGQSRDLWLRFKGAAQEQQASVEATLTYEEAGGPLSGLVSANLDDDAPGVVVLSASEAAFHESRALVCKFISSLFVLASDGEYRALIAVDEQAEKRKELAQLIESLPGRELTDDLNKALVEDLNGEQPRGQISLALSTLEYFSRWGRHFLPSYLSALSRQICNSFKDATPLQFGSKSPLFIACRDRLDNAFDNLPAPEPSRVILRDDDDDDDDEDGTVFANGNMAMYRNSLGVCFAGSTAVELASGNMTEIRKLKSGTRVRTPLGPRKVAMVLKTKASSEVLYQIGSLLVTPWHPLSMDGKNWDFPANMSDIPVLYTGFIYSVLLQPDRRPDAHAIRVADTWGVALGHGITRGTDIRGHAFFGDYMRVRIGLMKLEDAGRKGVVKGGGIERDPKTGLVRGFRRISGNAPTEKTAQV